MFTRFLRIAALTAVASTSVTLHAWDYEGHRLVNGVALAALPKDFPAFVRQPANAERIQFLAGEPDRWRNVPDLPLQQANGTEHYLDLEDIPAAGLDATKVPSFRLDFITQFATARAAHLQNFKPVDPLKNRDHSREWPGFAPWAVTEEYGKLRAAFSYLKVFEQLGTPEEIANAQANIVGIMGVMGHYVGDIAQPLHVTIHHHGWVGANPKGYTNWYGIHQWIDGGFIAKAGIKLPDLLPQTEVSLPIALKQREDGRDPMFVAVMDYLIEQNKQVEPLYALEKAGKLGRDEQPITPEGRGFVQHQLVTGGEMLAAIWTTAWKTAVPDTFLTKSLTERQARAAGQPVPAK